MAEGKLAIGKRQVAEGKLARGNGQLATGKVARGIGQLAKEDYRVSGILGNLEFVHTLSLI